MVKKTPKTRRKKPGQFSQEPEQGDLFVCEIANWPIKDDIASMEFPLFSLAKQKDTKTREYRRGSRVVRIIPSTVGAATVFDKDLLLYVASQIVEARNQGLPVSRHVQIDSTDFLLGTDRGDGAANYDRIIDMLRRLRGTTIETNIPTGADKVTQTEGFSMIDSFKVISGKTRLNTAIDPKTGKSETIEVERVYSFSVTISEWLYNGLLNFEVLTLDRAYFGLTRSIERRLYEIVRKHCGDQAMWKINIELLAEKVGINRALFKVRDEFRQTIANDQLPQYRMALDSRTTPDDVVFYTRDAAKLAMELIRTRSQEWFDTLERADNVDKWRRPKTAPRAIAA
jgi:plasmid replication initiation protein